MNIESELSGLTEGLNEGDIPNEGSKVKPKEAAESAASEKTVIMSFEFPPFIFNKFIVVPEGDIRAIN